MKLSHRSSSRVLFHLSRIFWVLACWLGLISYPLFPVGGEETQVVQSTTPSLPQKTRTVVADLLMIDGSLYVVRGERGEIRIEVTPDTQLSEKFKFGDRIKAVILPNDEALSITKAQPGEMPGITNTDSSPPPAVPSADSSPKPVSPQPAPSSPKESNVRVIVAELLMIDGNLYIIRTEFGEIQIEITPQTELSEKFVFGDRIKARVTPQDKALSIVRASPGEPNGIRQETAPSTPKAPPVASAPAPEPGPTEKEEPVSATPKDTSKIRTIVADILMIDGDFYVVRGERGEIRIEVTPKTKLSEKFKFGDRIKARLLPNDTAVSIERAKPDE